MPWVFTSFPWPSLSSWIGNCWSPFDRWNDAQRNTTPRCPPNKVRHPFSRSTRGETCFRLGVTVMLLATTIMLLVFRSPSAIISVMWLISAKMFVNEKAPFPLRKFHSIANMCATLNAATTFIMFIIYGTKFRAEFTRIYFCFLCKIKRKPKTLAVQEEHRQSVEQILPGQTNNKEISRQSVMPSTGTNASPRLDGRENSRHSSSATTSTTTTTNTSVGSIPSIRQFRQQRRSPRYSLEREELRTHSLTVQVQLQRESTIREDDDDDDDDDEEMETRSVTLTLSYGDCFLNLLGCRWRFLCLYCSSVSRCLLSFSWKEFVRRKREGARARPTDRFVLFSSLSLIVSMHPSSTTRPRNSIAQNCRAILRDRLGQSQCIDNRVPYAYVHDCKHSLVSVEVQRAFLENVHRTWRKVGGRYRRIRSVHPTVSIIFECLFSAVMNPPIVRPCSVFRRGHRRNQRSVSMDEQLRCNRSSMDKRDRVNAIQPSRKIVFRWWPIPSSCRYVVMFLKMKSLFSAVLFLRWSNRSCGRVLG